MKKNRIAPQLLAFLTASLLTAGSAAASSCHPCEYENCYEPWFDCFDSSVEFLLWKPCFDDLDYAVSYDTNVVATPTGVGKYKYVDHNFKAGVRFGFAKRDFFHGWDLVGSYTRVAGSDKNTTEPLRNGITHSTLLNGFYLFGVDEISSKHTFGYQSYDILFARDCTLACCHVLRPYAGVTGMFLSQEIRSEMSNDVQDAEVRWNSSWWGVGFRMGTGYTWSICDSFSFYANGSAAVTTGELSSKDRSISSDDDLDLTLRTNEWLFVPGYHIALGLLYDTCWCGKVFTFNLGYEFLEWYNVGKPRRTFDTDTAYGHTTSPSKATLGFHGLQIGAKLDF